MIKYFVVSDVHSFYNELMAALNEKGFEKDNPTHKLIICGDLFDRGPDTVKVFEFVKGLQEQGRLIYIRGNHELLLQECVKEIKEEDMPSWHHFSNGTVKTICQFCNQNEWIIYDPTWTDTIYATMQPILDFINKNCVNYVEIGDYILVHAWVPTFKHLKDFRDADNDDWKQAMWVNGMDMWRNPERRVEGKTVICGHWHANWGHSHIHNECSEWSDDAIFKPFVDEGIIAIDACTAYSGKVNCIILEVEVE